MPIYIRLAETLPFGWLCYFLGRCYFCHITCTSVGLHKDQSLIPTTFLLYFDGENEISTCLVNTHHYCHGNPPHIYNFLGSVHHCCHGNPTTAWCHHNSATSLLIKHIWNCYCHGNQHPPHVTSELRITPATQIPAFQVLLSGRPLKKYILKNEDHTHIIYKHTNKPPQ